MDSILKVISVIADVMTVLGLGGLLTYATLLKDKNLLGRRLFRFSIGAFRFALVAIVWIVGFRLSEFLYAIILVIMKGEAVNLYWEAGKEFQHFASYLVTVATVGPSLVLASLMLATSSLYYPRLFLSKLTGGRIALDKIKYARFANLEILAGTYGSATSFVNVTSILQSMVEDATLRVQATNSLAGDPIYGVKKKLTVKYRLDGIENEISAMEGDILEIPPKQAGRKS